MPASYPAPSEDAIHTVLAGLVSAPVKVAIADTPDPEREAVGVFAQYATDDDELAVLAFADPAAVNSLGGSMAELEADAVTEANGTGVVLDPALENYQEIANIFASCLNSDFTKHLRLKEVQKLPGQLTDEVKELWRAPRGRRAYRVEAEGLGAGSVILYLT